jgi:hypothetical protein
MVAEPGVRATIHADAPRRELESARPPRIG